MTCPRCVFKRFSLLHRLEVSRRVDAFLQDFSSAVVDSVPLVSGFVPFDLRAFSLQAVVTRLVDGGSILNQLLLGLLVLEKLLEISQEWRLLSHWISPHVFWKDTL